MPRFRLRTFLIVITAFCLLLGWRVAAVESVERPIRELERLGWEVSPDPFIYPCSMSGVALGPEYNIERTYWQKLCLGYRPNDLPTAAECPRLNEHPPADSATIEVGSQDWSQRTVRLLNKLPTISWFSVSSSNLNSENCAPFAELKHVRDICLTDCPIDDNGIRHLATREQLQDLYLWGTNITPAGIQQLKEALPDCEIMSDYD